MLAKIIAFVVDKLILGRFLRVHDSRPVLLLASQAQRRIMAPTF